jgi:hypothetical protein
MTALQAALAGAGGFGQGVVAQRERQQKFSQAEEERKRREMLDVLDVQERGYMRPEQLVQARQEAAAPTSRVAQSAILSALSPTRPAPLPSTADIATVMETSALRQPMAGQQRITVGGQEYVRPEAPIVTERRERGMERAQKMFDTAEARRMREEERREDFALKVMLNEQSKQMTPYQQAQLGIAQQELRLKQDEARRKANEAAPSTVGSKAFSREDVDFLRQFSPVAEQRAGGKTVYKEPKNSLNTLEVQFAKNNVTNWAAGANEQQYAAVAGAIADAKARASEKGVLTNQDIDRYRNSIIIRPGDSVATKYAKFQRMLKWSDDILGAETGGGMPNRTEDYR